MSIETLLFFLLAILVIAALPAWPYSRSWGYTPTGLLSLVLVVLIVWIVVGRNESSSSVGNDVRSGIEDVGQDIRSGAREAGQEIKELGRDVKRSVQDAAD